MKGAGRVPGLRVEPKRRAERRVALAACPVSVRYQDRQSTVGYRSAVLLVANRVTGGKRARQIMPTLEGVGMAPECRGEENSLFPFPVRL